MAKVSMKSYLLGCLHTYRMVVFIGIWRLPLTHLRGALPWIPSSLHKLIQAGGHFSPGPFSVRLPQRA